MLILETELKFKILILYSLVQDEIPCRVCGGKSFGVLCGVTACRTCADLFRFSQKTNAKYECNGKQNCVIDHATAADARIADFRNA